MAFPKIEGYVVTEKLGSGSYSTVYKAYNKVGGRSTVAVKCIDKSRVKHSSSAVDNLISEIRLLKTLTHPHIVHMKHFDWDDRNIYIIMEYCCGGDLSKYIHRYGRVPETQVLYFLQQLASALKFLREKNVVHMDLKPHNLLLHKGSDGKYILKVADFGFAQHMSAEWARSVRGSPLYMAPEMIAGEYDERVDLWSVGVIMYECLFGRAPYSSSTFKELIDKIHRQAPIEIPRNSAISPGCLELLTRLLRHRPDERISYEEFFNHSYLDLEHMPSKENYEKAVSLIKQAIELDSSGQLQAAFEAYRDSLLYLVPAVRTEADALRRGALTAKLTRYMERAEEIKLYLKHSDLRTDYMCHDPRAGHGSCEDNVAINGQQYSVQYNPADQATSTPLQTEWATRETVVAAVETVEQGPGVHQSIARNKEECSRRTGERTRTPPRFGLRRLFGRQASVPYLSEEDASITQDTSDKAQKAAVGETTTDGCRIT